MRRLFFVLLALNLLYAAWSYEFTPTVPVEATGHSPLHYKEKNRLRLVDEVPEPVRRDAEVAGGPTMCRYVGGMDDLEYARKSVSRLRGVGVEGALYERSRREDSDYEVYLPSQSDAGKVRSQYAQVCELGYPAIIIRKGVSDWAISFGVYGDRKWPDQLMTLLTKKGLQPMMRRVSRSETRYWFRPEDKSLAQLNPKNLAKTFSRDEIRALPMKIMPCAENARAH